MKNSRSPFTAVFAIVVLTICTAADKVVARDSFGARPSGSGRSPDSRTAGTYAPVSAAPQPSRVPDVSSRASRSPQISSRPGGFERPSQPVPVSAPSRAVYSPTPAFPSRNYDTRSVPTPVRAPQTVTRQPAAVRADPVFTVPRTPTTASSPYRSRDTYTAPSAGTPYTQQPRNTPNVTTYRTVVSPRGSVVRQPSDPSTANITYTPPGRPNSQAVNSPNTASFRTPSSGHTSFSRPESRNEGSRFLANSSQNRSGNTGRNSSHGDLRANAPSFGTAFNRNSDTADRFGRATTSLESYNALRDNGRSSLFGRSNGYRVDSHGDRGHGPYDGRYTERHPDRDHGDRDHHHYDHGHYGFSWFSPSYCYSPFWYSPFYSAGLGITWSSHRHGYALFFGSFAPVPVYTSYGYDGGYYGGYGAGYGGCSYGYTTWPVYSTSYVFEPAPVISQTAAPVYYEPAATATDDTQPTETTAAVPPAPAAETTVPLSTATAPTISGPAASYAVTAPLPETVPAPATAPVPVDPAATPLEKTENSARASLDDILIEEELLLYESTLDVRIRFTSYAEALNTETFWASYAGIDRLETDAYGVANPRILADNPL